MNRLVVAVDLRVTDDAAVKLINPVVVADAGRVVDRAGLDAQLAGGFLQASIWALCEEVTWDRDGTTSRDWESYPVMRFEQVPHMQVHILDRPDAPSVGAGQASPGPPWRISAPHSSVQRASGCDDCLSRRMPSVDKRS